MYYKSNLQPCQSANLTGNSIHVKSDYKKLLTIIPGFEKLKDFEW